MRRILFSIYLKIKKLPIGDLVLIFGGVFLALLLRYMLRSYSSPDYEGAYKIWFEAVKRDGLSVFNLRDQEIKYDYTPLYMYFLYIVSIVFPKLATISAVKIIPVTTDIISAFFIFKIVRLKYSQGPIPFFAAFALLFAPTIVLNSAVWGQTDSIYTVFLIASLYFILKKQNWWACLAFGFAISMKLQAVFFAPFLIALFLKREISWRQLLLVPAVCLVTYIPAWMAGTPIGDLWTTYLSQTNRFPYFELSFPNIYYQLPDQLFHLFYPATLIIAASMVLLYIGSIYKSRIKLTPPVLVQLALVSVVFMPYFLPKMHERYLYSADALSIVFGFYFPEYFIIPVFINLFSFINYEKVLFQMDGLSGYVLQAVLTLVVVLLGRIMIKTLYPNLRAVSHPASSSKPVDLHNGLDDADPNRSDDRVET
jgi:Gpi18-like mannosyltransferase